MNTATNCQNYESFTGAAASSNRRELYDTGAPGQWFKYGKTCVNHHTDRMKNYNLSQAEQR